MKTSRFGPWVAFGCSLWYTVMPLDALLCRCRERFWQKYLMHGTTDGQLLISNVIQVRTIFYWECGGCRLKWLTAWDRSRSHEIDRQPFPFKAGWEKDNVVSFSYFKANPKARTLSGRKDPMLTGSLASSSSSSILLHSRGLRQEDYFQDQQEDYIKTKLA